MLYGGDRTVRTLHSVHHVRHPAPQGCRAVPEAPCGREPRTGRSRTAWPGPDHPEGDTMSTVTMQDLELETAELLPVPRDPLLLTAATRAPTSPTGRQHQPGRPGQRLRAQRRGQLAEHPRHLAPARLAPQACRASPEGDAQRQEGRPSFTGGPPACGAGPGPAGHRRACEGGADRDRSRRAREHRAPGPGAAPGGRARARRAAPAGRRASSCSGSTRTPATASPRRWSGGPTARSSRCPRCCTRWPAGSTAPAAPPPSRSWSAPTWAGH